MKCPACNLICSDLRDICPSCLRDLRPAKALQGITVTHPGRTYDELVETLQNQPKHPTTKKKFTTQIWTKSSATTDQGDNFTTRISASYQKPPVAVENVTEISTEELSLLSALALAKETPALVEVLPLNEESLAPPVLSIETPVIRLQDQEPVIPLSLEPTKSLTPVYNTPLQTLSQATTPHAYAATAEMFALADSELRASGSEFDLEGIAIPTLEKSELIELYFANADDWFKGETSAVQVFEALRSSEERVVTAEALHQKVAKIESDAAQNRWGAQGRNKKPGETPGETHPLLRVREHSKAGLIRRLVAICIDGSTAILITAIAVTGGHIITVPEFLTAINTLTPPMLTDLVHIATLIIALVPATFILLQVALLVSWGGTPGSKSCNIQIVRIDGHPATGSQLMLRSLCLPLSFLVGGFLPILIGKNSLADWLARTKVVRCEARGRRLKHE